MTTIPASRALLGISRNSFSTAIGYDSFYVATTPNIAAPGNVIALRQRPVATVAVSIAKNHSTTYTPDAETFKRLIIGS